jgi:hypothetical protein
MLRSWRSRWAESAQRTADHAIVPRRCLQPRPCRPRRPASRPEREDASARRLRGEAGVPKLASVVVAGRNWRCPFEGNRSGDRRRAGDGALPVGRRADDTGHGRVSGPGLVCAIASAQGRPHLARKAAARGRCGRGGGAGDQHEACRHEQRGHHLPRPHSQPPPTYYPTTRAGARPHCDSRQRRMSLEANTTSCRACASRGRGAATPLAVMGENGGQT